jgi:hypothetical protein
VAVDELPLKKLDELVALAGVERVPAQFNHAELRNSRLFVHAVRVLRLRRRTRGCARQWWRRADTSFASPAASL